MGVMRKRRVDLIVTIGVLALFFLEKTGNVRDFSLTKVCRSLLGAYRKGNDVNMESVARWSAWPISSCPFHRS